MQNWNPILRVSDQVTTACPVMEANFREDKHIPASRHFKELPMRINHETQAQTCSRFNDADLGSYGIIVAVCIQDELSGRIWRFVRQYKGKRYLLPRGNFDTVFVIEKQYRGHVSHS